MHKATIYQEGDVVVRRLPPGHRLNRYRQLPPDRNGEPCKCSACLARERMLAEQGIGSVIEEYRLAGPPPTPVEVRVRSLFAVTGIDLLHDWRLMKLTRFYSAEALLPAVRRYHRKQMAEDRRQRRR